MDSVDPKPSFLASQFVWIAALVLGILLMHSVAYASLFGSSEFAWPVFLLSLPSLALAFVAFPRSKSALAPFLVLAGLLGLASSVYALIVVPVLAFFIGIGVGLGALLARVSDMRFKDRKVFALLLVSIALLSAYLWNVDFWGATLTGPRASEYLRWPGASIAWSQGQRLTDAATREIDASRPERGAKILAVAARMQAKRPDWTLAQQIALQELRLGDETAAVAALNAVRDEQLIRLVPLALIRGYLALGNIKRATEIADTMPITDRIGAAIEIARKLGAAGDLPAAHLTVATLLPFLETLPERDRPRAYEQVTLALAALGFDAEAIALARLHAGGDRSLGQMLTRLAGVVGDPSIARGLFGEIQQLALSEKTAWGRQTLLGALYKVQVGRKMYEDATTSVALMTDAGERGRKGQELERLRH
jgi:hypothetical protein